VGIIYNDSMNETISFLEQNTYLHWITVSC